jgi:hypothetical protein
MPDRLMVGQHPLEVHIVVQIHVGQLFDLLFASLIASLTAIARNM